MAATTKGRTAAGKPRAKTKSSATRPKGGAGAAGRGRAGGGRAGGRAGGYPSPGRAVRCLPAVRPCDGGGPGLFSTRLESHQVDILALALIAIGIFLGGVAYAHWNGGALGDGAVDAVRYLFGVLGYAVPAALAVCGALILLRELRPPGRPLRTGALCLTIALTLALAAGTLGIGPGPADPHAFWHADVMQARGGIIGQAEYWVSGASDLSPGRRHPRGVPGDRGRDPDQRRRAGRDRAGDRRGRARNRPGDPPLRRRPDRRAVTSSGHGGGPGRVRRRRARLGDPASFVDPFAADGRSTTSQGRCCRPSRRPPSSSSGPTAPPSRQLTMEIRSLIRSCRSCRSRTISTTRRLRRRLTSRSGRRPGLDGRSTRPS